jgi:hypothetical protein
LQTKALHNYLKNLGFRVFPRKYYSENVTFANN